MTWSFERAIGELVRSLAVLAQMARLRPISLGFYRYALQWRPTDYVLWYDFASASLHFGRPEQAEKAFRRVLEMNPSLAAAQYYLGEALLDRGRHDEAITLFQQVIEQEPDAALPHYNLGFGLAALNRHEEALPAFVEAVRLAPDWPDASTYVGICYEEARQPGRATPWLQKSVRLRGSRDDYVRLGANLRALEQLPEAEAAFRKALALDSRCCDVRLNLASVLLEERRFEEALRILDGATGGHSDALLQSFTSVVLVHLERLDDARRAAQRAIELGPTLGYPHFSLGYVRLAAGEASAALGEFETAIQIEGNHPNFLAGKAQALSETGQHADAVKVFHEVMEIDPELMSKEPELGQAYERSRAALGQSGDLGLPGN